jgi:hypothetical protein
MNSPPTPPKTNPEPKQRIIQRENAEKARMERMRAASARLQDALANAGTTNIPRRRQPPPMKTGGLIKSTGVYTLHKGEVVVPAARVKSVDMSLKKDNKAPLKK